MTTKWDEATQRCIEGKIRSNYVYVESGSIERVSGKKKTGSVSRNGYKRIEFKINSGRHTVSEHHIVWFLHKGSWPKMDIDHINGNRADNRIENLRECNRSDNLRNSVARKGKSSRFKGVSKIRDKWRAYICLKDGKYTHIGHFSCETAAAIAYDIAARKHFGEYAKLNFPLSNEMSAH